MTDAGPLTADPALTAASAEADGAPDAAALARKAHGTLEPVHIAVYFAREAPEVYAAAGLKGSMRSYFASRSAAMGRVPAEVVIATFYNFCPRAVRKAIPAVWDVTSPERILAARLEVADAALRRILGETVVGSTEMATAAALAREAAEALGDGLGRPLYAAHAALPWPEAAHLQLWHAQTLLREHRGDGHVAALVLADLDGAEALASYVPLGKGLPEAVLQATRGWEPDEWEAARERLRARGLLAADGTLTAAGRAQREQIETLTDRAAAAPWAQLGAERTTRLRDLVRPWSRAITEDLFGGANG
jgi:hypothetical protein